mmetsp:Transcript_9299/g.24593  ORF Transcript_9299/g.24593 Transcript_9299/m.24593 type:complete len:298 (-) Transcript_9299:826-1719(-)|eukprot:CAMPEP_0185841888 /NCGR_PEP_ID=MMETSP1353-20130828/18126_1 /TAXON_ID=1077150 /ORGANISM="Erythrolobus australicus, Strain CCMP3124" /LENGTH=297 /DNA_ID=CAMNT_0028541381 /DNA_START=118 /DNA_END=1011 /DNA_ORIENTATION=-
MGVAVGAEPTAAFVSAAGCARTDHARRALCKSRFARNGCAVKTTRRVAVARTVVRCTADESGVETDYFGDPVDGSSRSVDVSDEASGQSAKTTGSVETEKPKELIPRLLRLAASTERGQLSSQVQAEEAERVMNMLAAQSPTENPVDSAEIDGAWELVYSSAKLFMTNPLLAAAATPLLRVGQICQELNLAAGTLVTTVQVEGVPRVTATIETSARATPLSGERIEVAVSESKIQGGNVMGGLLDLNRLRITVPVEDIVRRTRGAVPEAYFDTIYLDKSFRIARSKAGNLYAFCKMD